jgi:hypothetical protein
MRHLSPSLTDWLLTAGGLGFKLQKSKRPDDGVDALFAPAPGPYTEHGEFEHLTIPGNGYTRTFEFHPERQRLAAAAILLAIGALLRWGGRG